MCRHECPFDAHEAAMCDFETILDWQQRGISARILGLTHCDNPLLKDHPVRDERGSDDWRQKVETWLFGWEIENSIRARSGSASIQ
jgi:hypothetical protein